MTTQDFQTNSLVAATSNKRWTFGVISTDINFTGSFTENTSLNLVINSILRLNISADDFEIIIVGANNQQKDFEFQNIKFIHFDENIKSKWITKKKNIIIQNAKYENVIITHDYVTYDQNWYIGFQDFDTNWDVCMCKILNKDGTRWRDWILWWCGIAPYKIYHNDTLLAPNRLFYDDYRFVNTEMYINGTVIIGKREYLLANQLDENLIWGQGEDCEWSARCRPTWNYKMNINSQLKLLKQHDNT